MKTNNKSTFSVMADYGPLFDFTDGDVNHTLFAIFCVTKRDFPTWYAENHNDHQISHGVLKLFKMYGGGSEPLKYTETALLPVYTENGFHFYKIGGMKRMTVIQFLAVAFEASHQTDHTTAIFETLREFMTETP